MKKPKEYNLTPAKGQALLNFQGRIFPKKVKFFEVEKIEEVKQRKSKQLELTKKEKELHPDFKNLLIQGDALSACAYLKSRNIKVDLVYIDPPFASGANYAKKIYLRNGKKTNIEGDNNIGEEIMYSDIWEKEDYLNWIYERLLAIRDIMSETASIYVHLDWHIGHYVKILLDEVFGEENFVNEIVWHYMTYQGQTSKFYPKKHDIIFLYSKSDKYQFKLLKDQNYTKNIDYKRWNKFLVNGNEIRGDNYPKNDSRFNVFIEKWKEENNGREPTKNDIIYKLEGYTVDTVWNIKAEDPKSLNRQNYTTQKPEPLLERIIKASSDKGMIVADFFCGSGTTPKVAHDLGRKFIACDVGINAIQTTRDRLVKAGASFDILKVKDGIRLFRNPAQTTAKLFSLIDGFKISSELDLGSFWDGGIVNEKGSYEPVKFIGIDKNLTKKLLDVILEETYRLEDIEAGINKVKLIYAYKDLDIDQSYVNKTIKKAGKTNIKVELVDLNDLLEEKKEMLYAPDNADIEVKKQGKQYKVKIKKYFSPYLKKKIDEYNARKVKKGQQKLENENKKEKIKISKDGLELIEAVQFDTTLKKNVWTSNLELEDKAGIKEKIKGEYLLNTNKFKIKIRNIAGDEIIISSKDLKL